MSETKKPRGRPFSPGVSGNPGGRPKGKRLSDWLREYGEAVADSSSCPKCKGKGMYALCTHDPEAETNDQRIAAVIVAECKLGNKDLIPFYADRTEGKVKEILQLQKGARLPMTDEELAARLKNKGRQK